MDQPVEETASQEEHAGAGARLQAPARTEVAAYVRGLIADGTLKPGDAAPNGAELSRATGHAAVTCRDALRMLTDGGELLRPRSERGRPDRTDRRLKTGPDRRPRPPGTAGPTRRAAGTDHGPCRPDGLPAAPERTAGLTARPAQRAVGEQARLPGALDTAPRTRLGTAAARLTPPGRAGVGVPAWRVAAAGLRGLPPYRRPRRRRSA